MNPYFFNTPSSTDLIGLPAGNYHIQEFPEDIAAGDTIRVTIGNVEKKVITFSEENLYPDKIPKQHDRLARHTEIELKFPYKIKAIKLFLDLGSRIVFVYGKRDTAIVIRPEILKPCEAHVITYYNKKKKKKVLNACFFGAGNPVTDIHRAMTECEVVIAVDTNSREVPGVGKVAATTAIEAYFNEVTGEACHMRTGPIRQSIMINPTGNPEIHGISKMMHHFFEKNPQIGDRLVGIITDSELDLLKGRNLRVAPFFENNLLPENTTLFYATSDSGSTECMANKLIRMCDNKSEEYLNQYINQKHST
ncbi:hypothetical protein [Vreelandella neptunia]|uniref:hypothetical protein n=1 Tax=Vreelandella neptunia TaxID=115551 RepID=UPI00315B1CF0